MKTLILVRHAKSSWEHQEQSDFDRPLNDRGLKDAPMMAKRINEFNMSIDKIFSSPAKRAFSTACYFAEEFNYSIKDIIKYQQIYDNGNNFIKQLVYTNDDQLNTIMIFGHNPDITSLSLFFSEEYFSNVPTCGIICIDFETDKWSEIKKLNGKLRFFEYPKKSNE